MGLLEDFLKNFREQTNGLTRPSVPDASGGTDRPILREEDMYNPDKGRSAYQGTFMVAPSKEQRDAARAGTLFQFHSPERGLSDDQKKDFLNNYLLFMSMANEWRDEDNVVARHRLTEKYDNKYNFSKNPIFSEMMRDMARYDDGEIRNAMGPRVYDGFGNPFTKDTRQEWFDWFDELTQSDARMFKDDDRKWRRA